MELLLETAGESHGAILTGILSGIPAGSPCTADYVNARLAHRQKGHGSSARQKTEQDTVTWLSGVRDGRATGNPIAMQVTNRDTRYADLPPVHTPRPGHADLAGALNRGVTDVRDIIERASARETAIRVAGGAVAQQFLEALGVHVLGHTVSIGSCELWADPLPNIERARARRDASSHHALADENAQQHAIDTIDAAHKRGDTLGGVVEVVATGIPTGLGGHERPAAKLTSGLAGALCAIQAVRGIEFGLGFRGASIPGSEFHDPIHPAESDGVPTRPSNRVGGIEGGMSNGQPIVLRIAMKPLATLRSALPSVDLRTGEKAPARIERSDVCAVSRLAIVAEAVTALEIARHVRRRFGGATLEDVQAAIAHHRERNRHTFGS